MANPLSLNTSNLPEQTMQATADTTSPARGREMRDFLASRLLQKNRAPPLVHSWDFWHDRQDRPQHTLANGNSKSSASSGDSSCSYEDRLEVLAHVDDVRKFWNVFNNFDISRLQLRDSIHLFHKGIKPVWEDPRNTRGGSWTFRVPKAQAMDFWNEICMMAIGEQLQQAVESERTTFRDDICGVNLGVRFNSMLIQIWNRDGDHQDGIEKTLATVLENLSPELKPREGTYYYKKHSEHAGFSGSATTSSRPTSAVSPASQPNQHQDEQGMQSLNAVVDQAHNSWQ